MNQYVQQMVKMGVNELYRPSITAKQTPSCPPIEMSLNGRTLTGSICAKMGYVLDGQTNWVGYCK